MAMCVIPVDSYPIAPTFSSAEKAIQHAKSYPPLAKARADEQLVLGSQIINAFWSDTDFVTRFSNGRLLHVFVDPKEAGRSVKWCILDSEPKLPNAELRQVGSPAVILKFSRAGEYLMDCSMMITARRGKDVRQFFVNELGFYLYTPKQSILCFGSVFRTDTGDNLLYVHEED
jgi:hypothetical protein